MNNQRPYILCHMMQTLDGKIASGVADKEILMDHFDTYTEVEHELGGKVWMFGRKTGEAFAEATGTNLPVVSNEIRDQDFIATIKDDTFAIIADTKGILRWSKNFVNLSNQENKFHLIILVTKQTPKEYLAYLQGKNISYILSNENHIDFNITLKKLKDVFKIEKILLEGGGSFNGSVMAADKVDEISLLLIPRVLNKKDAPALFDKDTDVVEPKDYQLVTTKQLDKGVLWLRYKK